MFLERITTHLAARSLAPASAFVLVAVLLGGAGSTAPLAELTVEMFAILMIARAAVLPAPIARGWAFWAILAVFAAWLILAMMQIVPLPPIVWRSLTMHETAAGIYSTLGWNHAWHPASLTPDRTLFDALAMLPALAGFLIVAEFSLRQRLGLLRVLVGVALLATLLGAFQAAAGATGAPVLFETTHRGYGVGFFVNRNHQAAFLLVAMVLAAVPGVMNGAGGRQYGRSAALSVTFGIIAFLGLGVLATTSRTGLMLLPLALLLAVGLVLEPPSGAVRIKPWRRYWLLGSLSAYAIAGAALYPSLLVQNTLARFATVAEDLRYQYWENTRFAIGTALPSGTGFGSFASIYRSVEPLSQVAPAWVNHAHSDYLELALEGGVAAILLMGAGLCVAIAAFAQGWRRAESRPERLSVFAGAAGMTLILVCAVVDYPMRMAAIGVLFGALLGLAVPQARARRVVDVAAPTVRQTTLGRTLAIVAVGLGVGWLSFSGGLSLELARDGQPALAATLAPWSAEGWSALANEKQLAGLSAESSAAAAQALRIAPLDADALRALAIADLAEHRDGRGAALMQLGAALGWRDTITQQWLARRALEVGNLTVATERIDGLLRRGVEPETMLRQLRALLPYPGGIEAIVARLSQHPPWQQGFLNAVAEDAPRATPAVLALLRALPAIGVKLDSGATALIRWRLADAGNYVAAHSVWRLSGGQGLIGDGDFRGSSGVLPGGAAPFAWYAPSRSGVHVTVAESEAGAVSPGRLLSISSDGYAAGPVLAQTVVLAPGRYRLGMVVRAWSGPIALPPTWSVSCAEPTRPSTPEPVHLVERGFASGRRSFNGFFDISAGCAGQTLALTIAQSAGQPTTLQIDTVQVTKVP